MHGVVKFEIRNSHSKGDLLTGATASVRTTNFLQPNSFTYMFLQLSFKDSIATTQNPKRIPFSLQLVAADQTCVGTLVGEYSIDNMPTSAQLVGGLHTEEGVSGKLLCDYLKPPNKYLIKLATESSNSCVYIV